MEAHVVVKVVSVLHGVRGGRPTSKESSSEETRGGRTAAAISIYPKQTTHQSPGRGPRSES